MFGKIFLNHPVGMEKKYVHDCVCLIYIYIFYNVYKHIYIYTVYLHVYLFIYISIYIGSTPHPVRVGNEGLL